MRKLGGLLLGALVGCSSPNKIVDWRNIVIDPNYNYGLMDVVERDRNTWEANRVLYKFGMSYERGDISEKVFKDGVRVIKNMFEDKVIDDKELTIIRDYAKVVDNVLDYGERIRNGLNELNDIINDLDRTLEKTDKLSELLEE